MSVDVLIPSSEFKQILINEVRKYSFTNTRLYRILESGKCSNFIARKIAESMLNTAYAFYPILAELIDLAPNNQAKFILLSNLMEEEGILLRKSQGLVVKPELRHSGLAERVFFATGGTSLPERVNPEVFKQTREYLRQGKWVEAVAYTLVGHEMPSSEYCKEIVPLLKGLGYSQRDLAFFSIHVDADERHGQEAIDLVVENATTYHLQMSALEAASTGCSSWYNNLGS